MSTENKINLNYVITPVCAFCETKVSPPPEEEKIPDVLVIGGSLNGMRLPIPLDIKFFTSKMVDPVNGNDECYWVLIFDAVHSYQILSYRIALPRGMGFEDGMKELFKRYPGNSKE